MMAAMHMLNVQLTVNISVLLRTTTLVRYGEVMVVVHV